MMDLKCSPYGKFQEKHEIKAVGIEVGGKVRLGDGGGCPESLIVMTHGLFSSREHRLSSQDQLGGHGQSRAKMMVQRPGDGEERGLKESQPPPGSQAFQRRPMTGQLQFLYAQRGAVKRQALARFRAGRGFAPGS